jgi:hypothetical protein
MNCFLSLLKRNQRKKKCKKFIEQPIEKNLKVMDMREAAAVTLQNWILKQQQFGRSRNFTFIANHVFLSLTIDFIQCSLSIIITASCCCCLPVNQEISSIFLK